VLLGNLGNATVGEPKMVGSLGKGINLAEGRVVVCRFSAHRNTSITPPSKPPAGGW
jgi:hypothetical protein